jgi:hypothetical protein
MYHHLSCGHVATITLNNNEQVCDECYKLLREKIEAISKKLINKDAKNVQSTN